MRIAPDALLDDGLLDVVLTEHIGRAAVPSQARQGLQGDTRPRTERPRPARTRAADLRRPAVRDLCRRRSDRRAPGHRPRPSPAPCACWLRHADAVRFPEAEPRAVRRRAVAPAWRRRHEHPRAPSSCASIHGRSLAWPGDLRDGSVIVSATNGKTTTAAMLAYVMSAARLNVVHNRAGANMAGGIASAMLEARGRGTPPADIGLFEVDEFYVPQVADQLAAAGDPARQPLPRPARPLRRARDDRRPVGGGRRALDAPGWFSTPTTR